MFRKLYNLFRAFTQLLKIERKIDEIKINQGRILVAMQQFKNEYPLWKYEFKVFSQWGEDGIIQFLVNNLEIRDRAFIEFGVEDFAESNCRFLMMKDQWRGFVIDGSEANIKKLQNSYYYWQHHLSAKAAFITSENIAGLLEDSGFPKDLGILSVDIDGIDYYVLEALSDWRPSIIIVEFNEVFGWDRPVTVPYEPSFVRHKRSSSNIYYGANLPAYLSLLNKRDYALVGTNSVSSNAFFVKRCLLNDVVSYDDLSSCMRVASFRESRGKKGDLTYAHGFQRAKLISSMPIIDVSTGENLFVSDLII